MHFEHAMVPGPVFVETKSSYWNCEKEKILALGYPRYDWMLHPSVSRGEALEKLFSHKDMKTVIWMPTFRKSEVLISAENEIELPFQLPALESRGGAESTGCSFKGMRNISDHQKTSPSVWLVPG